MQILGPGCLPPFTSTAWTQNTYNCNDGNLINDGSSLTNNMATIPPKSPLFNFEEKLSLNEKQIGSFDSINDTKEHVGKSSTAMVEGDDATLDDIKLSDFDLDFDVWNTVIDETQEENASPDDRFSDSDRKLSYSSSLTIPQEHFPFKQVNVTKVEDEKSIKIEKTDMEATCNNRADSFPSSSLALTSAVQCYPQNFDNFEKYEEEELKKSNVNQSLPPLQQHNATQFNAELITRPQSNQKQNHRIKVCIIIMTTIIVIIRKA